MSKLLYAGKAKLTNEVIIYDLRYFMESYPIYLVLDIESIGRTYLFKGGVGYIDLMNIINSIKGDVFISLTIFGFINGYYNVVTLYSDYLVSSVHFNNCLFNYFVKKEGIL